MSGGSDGRALAAASHLPAGSAPGRIMLLPAGRLETRLHDGREPWNNLDAAAVVAATRALGGELPIDYEHQGELSKKNGQPAPAAGWIKRVYAEAGAVWGEVEWTARAAAMIEAKEYRFVSPVFTFNKQTRDVTGIVGAALTNDPALVALSERALARADPTEEDMDLDGLRAALKLQPDATLAQIRAAAKAQREELDALRDERATAAVDRACREGQLAPAQRDWGVAYAKRDLDGFREYLRTAPPVAGVDLTRRILPSGPPNPAPGETPFRLPAGRQVDPEGMALVGRARARAQSEGVDFATALARETDGIARG